MSYEERLKKMKASIELNKSELCSNDALPDDVTHLGSPKIIKSNEDEIGSLEKRRKKMSNKSK